MEQLPHVCTVKPWNVLYWGGTLKTNPSVMEDQTPLSFTTVLWVSLDWSKSVPHYLDRTFEYNHLIVEVPPDESISSFIPDVLGINPKLFTDQRDAEHYRKSFITQTKASLQIQFPVLCMCNSLVWTNPHLIFTDIAYCFVFLFLCLANWFSIQTYDLKESLKSRI